MIKTILLMSLLLMALVVTRQAKAQMQQIYAALKEQIFEKECQKEAGLTI